LPRHLVDEARRNILDVLLVCCVCALHCSKPTPTFCFCFCLAPTCASCHSCLSPGPFSLALMYKWDAVRCLLLGGCHRFSFTQCIFAPLSPCACLRLAPLKTQTQIPLPRLKPRSRPKRGDYSFRLHGNCSYRLLPLVFRYITRAQDAPTGVRRRSHWLPLGMVCGC